MEDIAYYDRQIDRQQGIRFTSGLSLPNDSTARGYIGYRSEALNGDLSQSVGK